MSSDIQQVRKGEPVIQRFYKDEEGWFADIPSWSGDKAELAMVAGADDMLEIISQGESEVYITMSTSDFKSADKLERMEICHDSNPSASGAIYLLQSYKGIEYNLPMWLCDVTIFVFGDFPEVIYIH